MNRVYREYNTRDDDGGDDKIIGRNDRGAFVADSELKK